MDIRNTNVFMVHSSYKSLGGVEGGAEAVIDAFIELAGHGGTVLFPTFDFYSWTESHYFNIYETKSKMGVITELARLRKEAIRTSHPRYSFAVIGNRRQEFANCDDRSGFGENSVFALFHKLNGVVISIGIDDLNNTFTMSHYVEYVTGCNYRCLKDFSGIYIGRNRTPELKTYSMFVRAPRVETNMAPALTELIEKGLIYEIQIGKTKIHYTFAQDFFRHMSKIVSNHPEKLYYIVGWNE